MPVISAERESDCMRTVDKRKEPTRFRMIVSILNKTESLCFYKAANVTLENKIIRRMTNGNICFPQILTRSGVKRPICPDKEALFS